MRLWRAIPASVRVVAPVVRYRTSGVCVEHRRIQYFYNHTGRSDRAAFSFLSQKIMNRPKLPIAIYYEHPLWFEPLFAELDKRHTPYVRVNAANHRYDAGERQPGYSLFFNRMSSSAYTRGHGQGIFYTRYYLTHLELAGTPIVNGSRAFAIETSKALQLSLIASLGLAHPRTILINSAEEAISAAREIGFPLIVKPNIGGAGAGIARYESISDLTHAVKEDLISLGIDQTALVQEYIPPRGGHITRVETLDRRFLYAIRIFTSGESFNLCPAEICHVEEAVEFADAACPVEAVKKGLKVEAALPPDEIVSAVERIAESSEIDVGGVEYIIDDRDGRALFYDINALSNFVADATNIVGFDPHERLVDYLERRAF